MVDVAQLVWKQYNPPAQQDADMAAIATVLCRSGQGPRLGFEFDTKFGTFIKWVARDAMKVYRAGLEECISAVVSAADDVPSVLGVPFLNNHVVAFDLNREMVYFAQRKYY